LPEDISSWVSVTVANSFRGGEFLLSFFLSFFLPLLPPTAAWDLTADRCSGFHSHPKGESVAAAAAAAAATAATAKTVINGD
jgi:hypothetical protein